MSNDNTRKLAEHLAAIDTPEGAAALTPESAGGPIEHTDTLALRALLEAEPTAEPSLQAEQRGRNLLLSAVARRTTEAPQTMFGRFSATLATRGAAAAAGMLLFVGGTVGASAALGGPNLPDKAVTVTQHALGINNAPDAAQKGKDHANPKAFNGKNNANGASQKANENAAEAAETGLQNAEDGSDNADEGIGNASPVAENGLENATPQATPGSGNAAENTPEGITMTLLDGLDLPPVTTPPGPEVPPEGTPTPPSNPGDGFRP